MAASRERRKSAGQQMQKLIEDEAEDDFTKLPTVDLRKKKVITNMKQKKKRRMLLTLILLILTFNRKVMKHGLTLRLGPTKLT